MKSRAVQITRIFFYILAALWLAVGVGYIFRYNGQAIYWVMSGIMIVNAFVFIAIGANITKRLVYWLGVIFLAISIFLFIFDEFGYADLIALILFIIPLVIMLVKRKEFLAA
ncbi:MAG: hypothetical protein C4583_07515 [Anaerolineaceae bacterium]|nr:MAG: hypothetical protein C4583_07515 [Anaerolineaceae bacterium]